MQFEKQHGERRGIEDVLTAKKRFEYEQRVAADPFMYDAWFDYIRLEEEAITQDDGLHDGATSAPVREEADLARCREVFERAIANVPPAPDKRLWRRYIYLWLRCVLRPMPPELSSAPGGLTRAAPIAHLPPPPLPAAARPPRSYATRTHPAWFAVAPRSQPFTVAVARGAVPSGSGGVYRAAGTPSSRN